MKQYILLLLFAVITVEASAQKVFGIDITTTSTKYAKQLQIKKGWKPIEIISGEKRYKVTYAGYTNTMMYVRYDERNDSIKEVTFKFPNRDLYEKEDIFNDLASQFKQIDPKGKIERMDIPFINQRGKAWSGEKVSMYLGENDGNMFVTYLSKYKWDKKKISKPSDDI